MESCNGRLLQLIECIERTQNEVKKKMIESSTRHDARKSPDVHSRKKKIREAIILQFCEALAREHVLACSLEQHGIMAQQRSPLAKL
jgi:hypothetical protein